MNPVGHTHRRQPLSQVNQLTLNVLAVSVFMQHQSGLVMRSLAPSILDTATRHATKKKLRELATLYQVSYDELRTHALNYESRPPYIVDLAKNRLISSGRLIGEIIERKLAEQALRESEEKFREMANLVTRR